MNFPAKTVQGAVTLGFGVTVARSIEPSHWFAIATAILLWFSILAAAVLFRLGRGLPPFETEELKMEKIQRLTEAYVRVAKRLSVLFYVIIAAIAFHVAGMLIFGLSEAESSIHKYIVGLDSSLVAFVTCRAVMLVRGDVDLVALQSKLLNENAQKRRARAEVEVLAETASASPFEPDPDYGGIKNLNS